MEPSCPPRPATPRPASGACCLCTRGPEASRRTGHARRPCRCAGARRRRLRRRPRACRGATGASRGALRLRPSLQQRRDRAAMLPTGLIDQLPRGLRQRADLLAVAKNVRLLERVAIERVHVWEMHRMSETCAFPPRNSRERTRCAAARAIHGQGLAWRVQREGPEGPMTLLIALLLAAPPPQQLKPSMQAAMTSVVTLQPLIVSASAFRDPANAEKIRTSLDTLAPLDHFFGSGVSSPIASLFTTEISRAKSEFAQRDTESARARLRSISSLCFACHLRQPDAKGHRASHWCRGPHAHGARVVLRHHPPVRSCARRVEAPLLHRAEERRRGLRADAGPAHGALGARAGKGRPRRRHRGARAEPHPRGPAWFVTRQMERWLVEAKAWQAEKFVATKVAPSRLVARAKALIEMTGIAKQITADDALISHLRASGYLLEALRREPNASFRPAAGAVPARRRQRGHHRPCAVAARVADAGVVHSREPEDRASPASAPTGSPSARTSPTRAARASSCR